MSDDGYGGMGWRRDLPEFRDSGCAGHEGLAHRRISPPFRAATGSVLPASADLRKWCSRVRDQGCAGAAAAHAVAGLLEYFELRAFGHHLELSTRFLYKVTRDLAGVRGDVGANLRATLKTLSLVGAPPEAHFRYDPARIDEEPAAFCFAFADRYRTARYFRLDAPSLAGDAVLTNVRKCLAARLPSVFGVPVYSSFPRLGDGTSEIPYPEKGESQVGGHALVAVGYDDERMVGAEQGALLVRNSWGAGWGDRGYAWMPYKWVTSRMAVDFWSLVRPDFVNTDLFN